MRTLGPGAGTLRAQTYRYGIAAAVGHDLILEVERWKAGVAIGPNAIPSEVRLGADPRSLRVREGKGGAEPLSDGDRAEIEQRIDGEVLHGKPVSFRSSAVEAGDDGPVAPGALTIAGMPLKVRDVIEVVLDVGLEAG